MRIYEELFIVKPDAADEDVDAFVAGIEELIRSSGGVIEKTDRWGKRRLAYDVRGYGDGIYVLIVFAGPNTLIRELERRLRVADLVIKYITVRVDEERKRLAKKQRIRERRAQSRPAPSSSPRPFRNTEDAAPVAAPGRPEDDVVPAVEEEA
ncbi:MAG: 30S ribosomal protein S6 [Bryobacterales bacterium]|jgi:small subunit ribosomal protein S6|nr:30S ribosomal protein S6 [Bryobacterales bacterium]